ncbi:hypothetical protein M9H77_16606 [Catharanthus roseus]|uniref:Uncharacterized protein n=1 Tax=Catharanthus roseus TaxID=4058 RepID=A0ACC0B292_CATRO|nr:hypothetical protein M9H77_16606 [Catharanthus roseus]
MYSSSSFIYIRWFCLLFFHNTQLHLLATMAAHYHQLVIVFFLTLALANFQTSSSHVLKGSVTCLDCDSHYDLSEIKVLVRCSNVKKMALATTKKDGTFETKLPTSAEKPKCLAKIVGAGSNLLYTSGKKTISRVVKVQGQEDFYYTNSEPLNFYKSCPQQKQAECASAAGFDSSETVDIPLPREWGLAPSSYYLPFIPIIGIP